MSIHVCVYIYKWAGLSDWLDTTNWWLGWHIMTIRHTDRPLPVEWLGCFFFVFRYFIRHFQIRHEGIPSEDNSTQTALLDLSNWLAQMRLRGNNDDSTSSCTNVVWKTWNIIARVMPKSQIPFKTLLNHFLCFQLPITPSTKQAELTPAHAAGGVGQMGATLLRIVHSCTCTSSCQTVCTLVNTNLDEIAVVQFTSWQVISLSTCNERSQKEQLCLRKLHASSCQQAYLMVKNRCTEVLRFDSVQNSGNTFQFQ